MLCLASTLSPFGAVVEGWDPHRPLGDAEFDELGSWLAEHHVLVLRGHAMPSDEAIVEVAARFGPIAPAGELYGMVFSHRNVLPVSNELDDRGYERGVAGSGALPWHTDYAYMPVAAKETFLEAVVLPPGGGPDTVFCDLYAAFDALPAERRDWLHGRRARHTITAPGSYTQPGSPDDDSAARRRQISPELVYPDDGTGAWHPLVAVHPASGRAALYISTFIAEIEGCNPEESQSLVRELLDFAVVPERVYRHRWQRGDLVIFDTVGTMHRRDLVRSNERRTMRQLSTLLA